MFTRRIPGLLAALTLTGLALTAKPAQAQTTVYNTFGPSNSFDKGTGYTESGPNSNAGTYSEGSAFTVSQSGTLFSLTVAYSNAEGTNAGHLYLTDAFSKLGDTAAALEGFTLTNLPSFGNSFTPEVLTSVQTPTLTVGTTYYLYGLETGDTYDVLDLNNQGKTGTRVISTDGGHTYTTDTLNLPAFSVQVTPAAVTTTPEPASYAAFAMGGLGLLGLGLKARKRSA